MVGTVFTEGTGAVGTDESIDCPEPPFDSLICPEPSVLFTSGFRVAEESKFFTAAGNSSDLGEEAFVTNEKSFVLVTGLTVAPSFPSTIFSLAVPIVGIVLSIFGLIFGEEIDEGLEVDEAVVVVVLVVVMVLARLDAAFEEAITTTGVGEGLLYCCSS